MSQLRNYLLTINNPEQSDEQFFEYLKSLQHIKYFTFQSEKGEKEGTRHFQVYLEFEMGKRFETMKEYFPTAHIEPRKGTKKQAREYCQKADTRMDGHQNYEFGTFTESGDRSDLTDIMDDIEVGLDEVDLSRKHHGRYARHLAWADRFRQQIIAKKFGKIRRLDLEVTYIYGKAGVGKTRYVMDKFGDENVYRITDYDGNVFDNYNNEDIIIFEEFRSQIRIDIMLNFLDIYPLRLPARYNNKVACFTKVFIITNLPLTDQYKKVQEAHPETWRAFLRRIHKVFNFDLSKDTPVSKTGGIPKQTVEKLVPIDDKNLPF